MRKTNVLLTCVCAAASLAHADRPGQIESGSGSLGDGLMMHYVTVIEPPLKKSDFLLMGGGIQVGKNRVHRFVVDKATGSYFGYDLVAAHAGASNRYRVSIEPLSIPVEELRPLTGDTHVTPVMLPRYPPSQLVDEGDTIALELLMNPNGRQRAVDYIQVTRDTSPAPANNTATPKDYTVDDGPVTFDFQGKTSFLINSKETSETVGLTQKKGSTFWVYLPGRGRFVLSLVPREGYNFQKTGLVRDHVISFQADGTQYELRLTKPIVGSGGAWNLYVLADPQYRPQNAAANIISAGIDRIENLLPKRN